MKKTLFCFLVILSSTAFALQTHYSEKRAWVSKESSVWELFQVPAMMPTTLSFGAKFSKIITSNHQLLLVCDSCFCSMCRKDNPFTLLWGSSITPPKLF